MNEKDSIFYLAKNTMERLEKILKIDGDLPEEKRKEALKSIIDFLIAFLPKISYSSSQPNPLWDVLIDEDLVKLNQIKETLK